MLVSDVLTRATEALNDPTYERWSQASLIRYTHDAVLAVISVRPDAYPVSGTLTLVAGTVQALPVSALRLLDISHNASGRVVTYIDRDVLDRQAPSWRTATASTTIKHWVYDNKFPKAFEVYPPAKVGAALNGKWSATPAIALNLSDVLVLDDVYLNPVVEFVLFKAYSIDTEFSRQPHIAAAHLNAFRLMLGEKTSKDLAFSPDMNQKGAAPNPGQAQGTP